MINTTHNEKMTDVSFTFSRVEDLEEYSNNTMISHQELQKESPINEVFREAVAKKGLFYPPDPASRGSCFLGGNIAENAGGPKALKYGVTKDYVLRSTYRNIFIILLHSVH